MSDGRINHQYDTPMEPIPDSQLPCCTDSSEAWHHIVIGGLLQHPHNGPSVYLTRSSRIPKAVPHHNAMQDTESEAVQLQQLVSLVAPFHIADVTSKVSIDDPHNGESSGPPHLPAVEQQQQQGQCNSISQPALLNLNKGEGGEAEQRHDPPPPYGTPLKLAKQDSSQEVRGHLEAHKRAPFHVPVY